MSLNSKRAKAFELLVSLKTQAAGAAQKLAEVQAALENASTRLTILAENAAIKGDNSNTIDMDLVQAMTTAIIGKVNAYNLSAKINLPADPVVEIENASDPV